MEYRSFEAVLAKLHQIDDADMGAFRARLRVLRDMGVPPKARVGKGARVEFSDEDLAEMHLALTMSEFGWPPARIVQVIGFVRALPAWRDRNPDDEQWLLVSVGANAGKLSTAGADAVSRIGIFSTASLVRELKPSKHLPAAWHAVISVQRIAHDLAGVRS